MWMFGDVKTSGTERKVNGGFVLFIYIHSS